MRPGLEGERRPKDRVKTKRIADISNSYQKVYIRDYVWSTKGAA